MDLFSLIVTPAARLQPPYLALHKYPEYQLFFF